MTDSRDYLYQLHKSLITLCPNSIDDHVYDLQRKVALIEEAEKKTSHEHTNIELRSQNLEFQEEVEKCNSPPCDSS